MSNKATPEYMSDISRAATRISSSEVSACSVEPGSAKDVSKIVSYPTSTSTNRLFLLVFS
jgi:hypothetical protein